jgi:glutathione S-transferase
MILTGGTMAIDFYYGSGSPYAWRVWLALEHKELPYTLRLMSFDQGDLKAAEFRRINPRGRVPAIVDQGFALYESAAIVEYLEHAYPRMGGALFPAAPRPAAIERRLVREADQYLAHAMEELVEEILFKPPPEWNAERIGRARAALGAELERFEASPLVDATIGAAAFTVYPLLALVLRMERKKPDLALGAAVGPKLRAWMKRVEALPFFEKTYPPHWKAAKPAA